MKTQNIVLWLGLILLTVLLGCTQSAGENATTPLLETPLLPTNIATPIPTFTPPTIIDSPTPTSTPTTIPTLSVEQARARLLDLLTNNGNCHLPCLWGITIGKSSFPEVLTILMPLSSLSHSVYLDSPELGGIIPRYTEGNLEIYTAVGFLATPDSNIVYHLTFNAEAHRPLAQGGYEDVYDSKFFGEKVSAYSLQHILTEQGIPSSVMLETAGGPLTRGGTGGFDILLLYPDQGILVNYKTQMRLIGANVRGCPLNAYIQMELYSPGKPDLFFAGLKQTNWGLKMTAYQPIEEVTSMSVKEFYDTFRTPTDKCIDTPAGLWPTPEP